MKHLLWVLFCFACIGGACTNEEQPDKDEPRLPNTTITPSNPNDSISSKDSTNMPISIIDISKVSIKLCNPNASIQAQALYAKFLGTYGKKTFSGVTESQVTSSSYCDAIFSISGKYPAIVNYQIDSINSADFSDLSRILQAHTQNHIVAISWYWLTPSSQSDSPHNYASDSQFSIANALIDKNWEFQFLIKDLEKVADIIGSLKQADIPVIFNPFCSHTPNSWWTKQTPLHFTELWKLVYDQLSVRHQLDNIIWVWTANTSNLQDSNIINWYPGKKYVDLVNITPYGSTQNTTELFKRLYSSTVGSHMLTLTTPFTLPDPDKTQINGDIWLYFNAYAPQDNGYNSTEYWNYIMNHVNTITANP